MNVRDLNLALRPRSEWEAVDLGASLAKRYYRDLFRMGVIGFGPFFLLLALLCWFVPYLLPVLILWLKPLYDRFYLYYLSRRIFGQEVSVKETWGQWKQLFFSGSLSLLTIRRISGNRSMTLAVSELENLKGTARSQRSAVVSRVGGGQAFLITLGGLALEALALFSVYLLAVFLIPQGQNPGSETFQLWIVRDGVGQTLCILTAGLLYGLVVLLLEPIYLASGFALYLNSRTIQEAWDIELRFRELSSRIGKTRVNSSRVGTVAESDDSPGEDEKASGPRFHFPEAKHTVPSLLLALLFVFGVGENLTAVQTDPQVVVEEVLADEDFEQHVEKYKEWVPNENNWLERWLEGLDGGGGSGGGMAVEALFQIIGILALVLLAIAIVVLLANLLKNRALANVPMKEGFKRPPPSVVMGMEVTAESLPDDLLGQAKAHWLKGESKLAMSLLYRGALSKLILEKEVNIESSDTEFECLAQVKQATPGALADYFQGLSNDWMQVAYSKNPLPGASFERLCQTWPFERRKL